MDLQSDGWEAWDSVDTKSPGEGSTKGSQKGQGFGVPAGVTPCGRRFFPVESGAGPRELGLGEHPRDLIKAALGRGARVH